MKNVILLLFFPFLFGSSEPFQIISSSAETYYAGARNGGKGTNIHIQLIAKKSSKKLTFNEIKKDTLPLKLAVSDKNGKSVSTFNKNDTLYLKGSTFSRNPKSLPDSCIVLYYSLKGDDFSVKLDINKITKTYHK